MKLLACGDSWVWGYELVDPEIQKVPIAEVQGNPINIHLEKEHVEYRHKHRYVNLLANKINAEVVDLSATGISNWSIARRLLEWLTTNKYNADDLFVSIGWTSPVRNEFYIDKRKNYVEYGPWFEYVDYDKDLIEAFKSYTTNLFSMKKQMVDYFMTVYFIENVLKNLNIKYVMHQAFYDNEHWLKEDDARNVTDVSNHELMLLDNIDKSRFVDKHVSIYKSLFYKEHKKYMFKWHPNELGHQKIYEHIYSFCVKQGIL